jgi:hypothetical protein
MMPSPDKTRLSEFGHYKVKISVETSFSGNLVVPRSGKAYDARVRGPHPKCRLNSERKGKTMLRTILIILLVLFLLGALPTWPYSASWGYYPSGGLGFLLIVVIILIVRDIV